MENMMSPMRAMAIAEGMEETDEETWVAAWQYLVDSQMVWTLPGTFGRRAQDLIAQRVISG